MCELCSRFAWCGESCGEEREKEEGRSSIHTSSGKGRKQRRMMFACSANRASKVSRKYDVPERNGTYSSSDIVIHGGSRVLLYGSRGSDKDGLGNNDCDQKKMPV